MISVGITGEVKGAATTFAALPPIRTSLKDTVAVPSTIWGMNEL